MHKDYVRMFDSIIDNNVTILQNLEALDKDEQANTKRRILEKKYRELRKKLREGAELNAGEILFLGVGVMVAYTSIKTSRARAEKTIGFFENNFLTVFEQLKEMPGDELGIIRVFKEHFQEPIDQPVENVSQ